MKFNKFKKVLLISCIFFSILLVGCEEDELGWIAFIQNEPFTTYGNLYTMNYSGGELNRLTSGGMDAYPKWSPDKKKIVFNRWNGLGRDFDIYLINSDGTGEIGIIVDPSNDLNPVWSPDGEKIAFTSDRDGYREIFIYNLEYRSVLRLEAEVRLRDARHPAWSPDGNKIAFWGRDRPGSPLGIYLVDITNKVRL